MCSDPKRNGCVWERSKRLLHCPPGKMKGAQRPEDMIIRHFHGAWKRTKRGEISPPAPFLKGSFGSGLSKRQRLVCLGLRVSSYAAAHRHIGIRSLSVLTASSIAPPQRRTPLLYRVSLLPPKVFFTEPPSTSPPKALVVLLSS